MSNATALTPAEDAFVAAFDGADALHGPRRAALEAFAAAGLPHKRVEDWKYTDLRASLREALPSAAPSDAAVPPRRTIVDAPAMEIVVENGFVRQGADKAPEGVSISSLSDALAGGAVTEADAERFSGAGAVDALNAALAGDGVVLSVADGVTVETPVLIRYRGLADAGAFHARSLIDIGAGAEASVIELYEYEGGGLFANVSSSVRIADGAALKRYILHTSHDAATDVSTSAVRLAPGAAFTQSLIGFGGKLSRFETHLEHLGEGAVARLDGAFLLGGRRHADTTTRIVHAAPEGETYQRHKNVVRDTARSVFQGKFLVERPAQKTDAQMGTHTLLLSDGAAADAKPELEIYADDVKCAHGATSGALDDDALFYLGSRGVPPEQARALLVEAFLNEIIDDIDHDGLQADFKALVRDWLAGEGAA